MEVTLPNGDRVPIGPIREPSRMQPRPSDVLVPAGQYMYGDDWPADMRESRTLPKCQFGFCRNVATFMEPAPRKYPCACYYCQAHIRIATTSPKWMIIPLTLQAQAYLGRSPSRHSK